MWRVVGLNNQTETKLETQRRCFGKTLLRQKHTEKTPLAAEPSLQCSLAFFRRPTAAGTALPARRPPLKPSDNGGWISHRPFVYA